MLDMLAGGEGGFVKRPFCTVHATTIVSPLTKEINKIHPLLVTDGLYGAAHTPDDGHIDASGTTHALAKAARSNPDIAQKRRQGPCNTI